jgi:RNA polymerase sigma-70 factor (ECF subfamily)
MVEDLEGRALQGDERAWNELIARHQRRVRTSLLAKGASPPLANDLVQETWMRLIQQQRAGKLTALKLPGLAIRQADFLLRSHRRRPASRAEARSEELDDPESFQVVVAPEAGPEARAIDREKLSRTLDALDECSERSRIIFMTVYNEGLTAAQAASRFNISVQRVRQTLCEVRGRLRAAVGVG